MSSLKDRLRQARFDAKLTQEELCTLAKVKQPTYSALEAGKSKGSKFVPQIAKALGVNPYWLATGEGDKHGITEISERPSSKVEAGDTVQIVYRLIDTLDKADRRAVQRYLFDLD